VKANLGAIDILVVNAGANGGKALLTEYVYMYLANIPILTYNLTSLTEILAMSPDYLITTYLGLSVSVRHLLLYSRIDLLQMGCPQRLLSSAPRVVRLLSQSTVVDLHMLLVRYRTHHHNVPKKISALTSVVLGRIEHDGT
jgi:hypothetical protein